MDNRQRIRELTDEAIALADDRTLCPAERALRIKTRERAVRALLQAEKQTRIAPKRQGEFVDDFDAWMRLGSEEEEKGRANGSILDPQGECPYPALSAIAWRVRKTPEKAIGC